MEAFHSSWPDGFHGTISTKVKTMTVSRKKITVGPGSTFDTALIYKCVMGIAASRELDLKQVFQHELAPVPTSMFKDNGDMLITKTKSTLKNKLQVKQPVRTVCKQPASLPEVTIIDGCASSPMAQCVAQRAPICSNAYGGWFAPRPRHCVRMTYRPSAALRLLGSVRISHNKFLRANKWILPPYCSG